MEATLCFKILNHKTTNHVSKVFQATYLYMQTLPKREKRLNRFFNKRTEIAGNLVIANQYSNQYYNNKEKNAQQVRGNFKMLC